MVNKFNIHTYNSQHHIKHIQRIHSDYDYYFLFIKYSEFLIFTLKLLYKMNESIDELK